MKSKFTGVLLLTLLACGCNTYRPTDIIEKSDRLKAYWLNPQKAGETIYMGEDSDGISIKYESLFAGKNITKQTSSPTGIISFFQGASGIFDCNYALGTKPWISFAHDGDTIYLQLDTKATSLLSKYKAPTPERFAWLRGTWISQGENRPIFEEWTIGPDNYLRGKNYSIYAGDTSINEQLAIKKDRQKISYIANVFDQNGSRSVAFEWQPTADENILNFSNPWHDFPQDITYRKITQDSIVAVIKGRDSSFEMGMRKLSATASNP